MNKLTETVKNQIEKEVFMLKHARKFIDFDETRYICYALGFVVSDYHRKDFDLDETLARLRSLVENAIHPCGIVEEFLNKELSHVTTLTAKQFRLDFLDVLIEAREKELGL